MNVDGVSMAATSDMITGLVRAGRWPDFPSWCEARHPVYDTDDPLTLLGKLF